MDKRGKIKIILFFSIMFLVTSSLLLLVYFKGSTTYEVTFDLNGGTLISGSTSQVVTRGQDAEPPVAVKSGCYLHSWSTSYQKVTKNLTVTAIWEYETTAGIIYASDSNKNFTEITGSYPYIHGEIFIGAYNNKKPVLGLSDGAFKNRAGITKVFLLNGLMTIGSEAFADCTSLNEIEIPKTVMYIKDEAFINCTSLETLKLNDGLIEIGEDAFKNCTSLKEITIPGSVKTIHESAFSGCTSLKKIIFEEGVLEIKYGAFKDCSALTEAIIPASVEKIYANAFSGCSSLTIKATHKEGKDYSQWQEGWSGTAMIIWVDDKEADAPSLMNGLYEDRRA